MVPASGIRNLPCIPSAPPHGETRGEMRAGAKTVRIWSRRKPGENTGRGIRGRRTQNRCEYHYVGNHFKSYIIVNSNFSSRNPGETGRLKFSNFDPPGLESKGAPKNPPGSKPHTTYINVKQINKNTYLYFLIFSLGGLPLR
jgi:hypothetical protein